MAQKPRDKEKSDADALSADDVAAFLTRHPRFFLERPELLELVSLPETRRDGTVVDLRGVLVERLRGQVRSLASQQDDLIATARGNNQTQERVHKAVLALLGARSFEHFIELLTTDLAALVMVDVVALGVEQKAEDLPPVRFGGVFQLEPGTVDRLIGPGKASRVREATLVDTMIYGAAGPLVKSDALLRLTISSGTPPALLALGSRTPGQFHPGQASDLLHFIGEVVELLIRGWLHLEG